MDYGAEQEMELEALQAILMDDLRGKFSAAGTDDLQSCVYV